ncbi:MAG: TonB-dependent receptor [Melioribacteraceae bacterium]|nr:TonB-dependent receptor [Melioribacteraceae bacterium]
MIKTFFSILMMISILCFESSFAGTTGKIAGKVTDAETGEPLFGVNVIIEGTSYGAATDIEGEYYIINIPPGMYTVKASMIGFTPQRAENIRVQTDLTTEVNFNLGTDAIELGETVLVTARNEIQKDLTSSERSIQSEKIDELPVKDITNILSMQAGVTKDASGNLHIRGGRTTEISYMIDGVQVMNPVNRSAGINIDDQAISELKAITGTFNAEYGQALSGVVNIVTKQGSDKFAVNVTAYGGDHVSFDTDLYSYMDNREWAVAAAKRLATNSGLIDYDFSQHGISSFQELNSALETGDKPWLKKKSYLDSYNPFNNTDLQVNISGPIPFTNNSLSYFIAGRMQNTQSYQKGREYFEPWGIWRPIEADPALEFETASGDEFSLSEYEGYSTQSKLFFNSGPISLSYGIYYNKDYSYSARGKYLLDGGRHFYTDRITQIFTATYVFSNSTFLDFRGSYYTNDHENYAYENPRDYRYVPTNAGDFQQYMFDPERDDNWEVKNNPNDYAYWGNDVQRTNNNSSYISLQADLTSQIDKRNMMKMGVSVRMHDLEQDYYQLQFSEVDYSTVIPGRSSAYHSYYAAKPFEFAAYIQDKLEFEELIINLGLRFDYFDSDGNLLADPRDPQIYQPFKLDHIYKNYDPALSEDQLIEYTVAEREKFWWKKTDPKMQLSPRFGISFPITAEGVIHFSYGHFFQNPEFRYLYANPNFWITGAGSQNLVGNSDLGAERTVMYEIGLQQQLMNNLFLHVTGFYRDIRDWVGTGFPVDTYRGVTYYSYVNKDHATAKGITISASIDLKPLTIDFDYTFQQAQGTSSNATDAYNDLSAGRSPRVQLINLDWDQPHAANMIVNYSQDGWVATLTGNLNSGFPYTPEFSRGEAVGSNALIGLRENSERRPLTMNFDFRVSKSFRFGDLGILGILSVNNLFDTRNANFVYADTGEPDFTLEDYLSTSRFVEITNTKEYFANPGMFSAPRYIQIGFRLSYK